MLDADFAVAVFPFLKTSTPVRIGGYVFRSTDDVKNLTIEQTKAIAEIAQMLFVRDDLRVKSASYAIIPTLQVHSADLRLNHLGHLRNVVAYLYADPHEIFGDVFLSPEEISLVLFTPARVSVFLTRPEHHTTKAAPSIRSEPDSSHYVQGYNGVYNFRDTFWVEAGSRVYGPKPHMVLNISQDLHSDFEYRMAKAPGFKLLKGLLEKPDTPASLRIYSSIHWFNAANEHQLDQSQAVLNLAVAFETLLRLPESSKTDRLVDAISLLLGRTERLDDWAKQFYAARSQVTHEGELRDRYFYVPVTGKGQHSDVFGSLMLYGRQIFRLCVSTLLVGIDLAERVDLQEKFVTNNERLQKLCKILEGSGTASERLIALESTIRALDRYRFVRRAFELGPSLAAVKLACAALGECNQDLFSELTRAVANCAAIARDASELQRLDAVHVANEEFEKLDSSTLTPEVRIVKEIINLVWMSLFPRYFWLKERAERIE